MLSTSSSTLDDKYSKGILLIAVLFFSWLLTVKNFALDWTDSTRESQDLTQPNILLIVVDDLGYDDTSAINSSGLPTPSIKQLAQQGVTFRRHYADATCTPSRVAILTGRYPERSGFRPVGPEIPAEFSTIAEQLSTAGYATYLTGKWHAGEDRVEAWPGNKGFDQWFGFLNQWELAGEVSDLNVGNRRPTYRNPMLRKNGGELTPHNGHLTDILTDHTIHKLQELEAGDKPWFLYHAFLAPHQPIQPAQRFKVRFPDTPAGKYSALVSQLDDSIGRILGTIDRSNTLVVFVSDNGGTNRERNNNFPFYGKKGGVFEGSFRTPLIISWPGVIQQEKFVDSVVMNVDIYPTILASAHTPPPENLDGKNLWPVLLHDNASEARHRSWETFRLNTSTLSFSFLSKSGEWRLASSHGTPPDLFQLSHDSTGEVSAADQNADIVAALTAEYWKDHWKKSTIATTAHPGNEEGQTLYRGFDAMRTPHRYGFAIGIEIGPLPPTEVDVPSTPSLVLAGQKNVWELRYQPGHGLEWHIGDSILRDASFEPSRCNAVILTGYFQPKGHIAKRDPRSQIKFYSSGFLRDVNRNVDFVPGHGDQLHAPTFVNFDGKALFSNMMLSSFSESYSPDMSSQFLDIYTPTFRAKKLIMANVSMMNAELCK
mgnify:FL=1|tara:strand:+ start:792 stop:2756 length:1965 start_codon:yes stop_codon:yes gene_type:complete